MQINNSLVRQSEDSVTPSLIRRCKSFCGHIIDILPSCPSPSNNMVSYIHQLCIRINDIWNRIKNFFSNSDTSNQDAHLSSRISTPSTSFSHEEMDAILTRANEEVRLIGLPPRIIRDRIGNKKYTLLIDQDRAYLLLTHTSQGNLLIGKGSKKKAKLAIDLKENKEVIVCTLSFKDLIGIDKNASTSRFEKEISIQKKLKHPNILELKASVLDKEKAKGYVIFDRCETTLDKAKEQADVKTKIQWSLQLTEGVIEMHRNGTVHTDLHANNIYIKDGAVMIADFGEAQSTTENSNNSLTRNDFLKDIGQLISLITELVNREQNALSNALNKAKKEMQEYASKNQDSTDTQNYSVEILKILKENLYSIEKDIS